MSPKGDGREVDFLARPPDADEELIQACADPPETTTLVREHQTLNAAASDHPRAIRRVLVLDRDGVAAASAPDLIVQPIYEWLLAPPGER